MFEIVGWIFAAFVSVVWLIVCVIINSNWSKQSEKMLQSYSDLFTKIHDDYSDMCKRQSDEWYELSTRVLKEAMQEVDAFYEKRYQECAHEAECPDEYYYPEETEDDMEGNNG